MSFIVLTLKVQSIANRELKKDYFCGMFEPTIEFREVTRSTNQDIKDLIERNKLTNNKLPELFTLYAGFQEAGRGQGDNRWFSDAGENILATIHFQPPISAAEQFRFNQFFSISIRQLLLKYVPEVEIKWPNDIYVENKKIAGILIEHSVCGERLSHTIAGIGLNVNQEAFISDAPNPISMFNIFDRKFDLNEELSKLLEQIGIWYQLLADGWDDKINEAYLSRLYRKGELCNFVTPAGERFSGQIENVEPNGRLAIDSNGEKRYFWFKEVSFWKPDSNQPAFLEQTEW